MAGTKNSLTCVVSWEDICKLSVMMTNHICEKASPDLVYIADNSFGERDWEAGGAVQRVDNGYNGDWIGFQEAGSSMFFWGSASSGATIEATKEGSWWELKFVGTDIDRRGAESWYATAFAIVADPYSIEMVELPESFAFLDQVRVSQDDLWSSEEEKHRRHTFVETLEGLLWMEAPLTEGEWVQHLYDSGLRS